MDAAGAGMKIPCPKCGAPITVPEQSTIPPRAFPPGVPPRAGDGEDTHLLGELHRTRRELEMLLTQRKEETQSIPLDTGVLEAARAEAHRERERREQLEAQAEAARAEAEERCRQLGEERDRLRARLSELEAQAAGERDWRARVRAAQEGPAEDPEAQPPKTIHALVEEVRSGKRPLLAPTPIPSEGRGPEPPLPAEPPGKDGEDAGGSFIPSVVEVPRPMAGLVLAGWLCLMAGAVTLLLDVTWLAPAAALMALALGAGLVARARRHSPMVTGLVVMSLLISAVLWGGVELAGFRGILAAPAPAAAPVRAAASPAAPPTEPRAEPAVGMPTAAAAPVNAARIGESMVVDGVRIRVDAVSVGPVVIHDILGKTLTPDRSYLVVDLTLENTRPDRPVFLKQPWEMATLTDNLDNNVYVIYQQRLGLDRIDGSLRSTELLPGAPARDRIVFDLPVAEAEDFVILSDPGFYTGTERGHYEPISRDSLRIRFRRDEIAAAPTPPAAPAAAPAGG